MELITTQRTPVAYNLNKKLSLRLVLVVIYTFKYISCICRVNYKFLLIEFNWVQRQEKTP